MLSHYPVHKMFKGRQYYLALTAELLDDDNENLAAILARGDSNESNESLGDVPIELRHLEDNIIPSHLDDGDDDEEEFDAEDDEAGENTWTAYYKVINLMITINL